MARRIRSSTIETRTQRLRLPVRKKPVFVSIAPGVSLGYRRNRMSGSWILRSADGKGGNWTKAFAIADDHEPANGEDVLDFWQAQDRARQLARNDGEEPHSSRPTTVGEALDDYETALLANGGEVGNVTRVRHHLPRGLAAKAVALLNARELRAWRNGLVKNGLAPPSADRTARILKAALNLAASDDQKITNAGAWRALKRLPDTDHARNVILTEDQVRAVVVAAYDVDSEYGLLIELAAVTGARRSQLVRVTAGDIQDKGPAPRLMMPSSKKGRKRRIDRKPLPISAGLAKALRRAGRGSDDLLFPNREPWRDRELFARVRTLAGVPTAVTPYALRHSSIVRQLLANVPVRVVAANHDTSVPMIEANYSKHITGDPSDAITRRALLDLSEPTAGPKVVPILGAKS
jgi:integrase